ncbi:hypothetical protein [Namhaeicola litoreus]|uniref:Gylcosyl hydrolase 115 C-terminal domain-containing protein n=1 Tax=Namhaeicola litoreus TaxID=1052145 RepID=A0ABW3Y570_9FLAO
MGYLKLIFSAVCLLNIFGFAKAQTNLFTNPVVDSLVVFEEKDGLVAVEAEYFYKQSKSDIRQWYRTSKNENPQVGRDDDGQHVYGASNNAYLEILPDERVTHSDKLIHGENFSNDPGLMGVLHYRVKINTPGRYFVWVRALSVGAEDNGIHVGLNDAWPEHGQRMQWCEGKGNWTWESKQRTKEVHCGVPKEIYLDIAKAGIHDIQFSMREDGFEFDKFILTTYINFLPIADGPKPIVSQGILPSPFPIVEMPTSKTFYFTQIAKSNPNNKVISSQQFPVLGTNFYAEGKHWLAINPKDHEEASTSVTFDFESGNYDIVFVGIGENDGRSSYMVLVNDKEIGKYQPPLTNILFEEGKNFNALWENTLIKKGDKITVIAKIGSTDGKEHTRGRWAGIIFAPVGKGKQIQEAPSSFSAK